MNISRGNQLFMVVCIFACLKESGIDSVSFTQKSDQVESVDDV